MTVIAYRDGLMAADKKSTYFGVGVTSRKIRRFGDGSIAGCSGEGGVCRALLEWYATGADPGSYPDAEQKALMLLATSDGSLRLYDGSPFPILIEDEFFAIGSGKDAALAAMHLGHDAAEAVRVACLVDDGCGRGIDMLDLDDAA